MNEGILLFLLLLLKVLGLLLSAFFAVSEYFREKGKTPEQSRRSRHWSIVAILASLAVAVSAEALDIVIRHCEATNT
jgi:hypothetical protein